jgi:small ligand-binding sensory domain FIST
LKLTLDELHDRSLVPPVFGLYFNCVSRGRGLYDIPGHDVAYIRQSLGPIPIGGFFTGFEIGPAGPAPGFLQYSGVLTLAGDAVIKH